MGTIIENGNRSLQKSKIHPSFKTFLDPLYYQQNFLGYLIIFNSA